MKHGIKGRKFSRRSEHRTAMFMNLSASLIKHEQIRTTLPKAKDLRPIVEKLVTKAKKNSLHSRRELLSFFSNDNVTAEKLLAILGPRYAERPGGYIRIMKAGFRRGDMSPMAVIEFVDRDISAKGKDSGPVMSLLDDDEDGEE
jgi:large subunit ribosomal protein L17